MTRTNNHFLSVIVPAYKQEATIVRDIKRMVRELEPLRYDYELIVVLDGMVDRSLDKLKKLYLPKVRVLAYERNRGKSFAVRLGMSKARGDYIMFIDSGMEIDPNGMSMLLEHMEWYEADIIVGSKRHPASRVDYNWQRKILSLGYYYFVKFTFGIKVRDTQAGIKVFRKQVLQKVLPRLVEKRFAGDLEMLVVAKHLGFKRIYEAPIKLNYHFSRLTSAATINSILGILQDTMAIFYRTYLTKFYSKPGRRMKDIDSQFFRSRLPKDEN